MQLIKVLQDCTEKEGDFQLSICLPREIKQFFDTKWFSQRLSLERFFAHMKNSEENKPQDILRRLTLSV